MRAVLQTCAASFAALVLAVACSSSPAVPVTPPPGAVQLFVDHLAFQPAPVTAPADRPFVLFFDNRDSVPHNVHIVDGYGQTVIIGDVLTGPAAQLDNVPSLAAGTYRLRCDVHPDMSAELVASP